MSGLPWLRLDSGFYGHDKILSLLDDDAVPAEVRYRAGLSYVFALGWSAQQGTDGRVPRPALRLLHATVETARLLQKHGLWDEAPGGWDIVNYGERQQTAAITLDNQVTLSIAGKKGMCHRWHKPGCECWSRSDKVG